MSETRRKVAALMPLVERMHRGHCWVKTTDGPRRIDDKLDDFKIAEHVAGRKAYGACPIVPGESTCRVACLDLDSHKGETPFEEMLELAQSVAFLLEQDGYAPHIYRSSGGSGIHIYLLWESPQDAYSVREMLKTTLAALGYTSGTGGVAKKQIEVFPKQNEVPTDGYGSMFVLPGSGKSEPLGQYDRWACSAGVPVLEKPERVAPGATDSPALAQLRSALDAIPNDTDSLDYDQWRNTVFAIHHATDGSDDGLALAHEFSQRSSKYDPEFLDNRVWPYIGINSAEPITERSLFALAGQHGWQDPTVIDDFEVLEVSDADDFEALPAETLNSALPAAQRFTPIPAHEFAVATQLRWLVKGVLPQAELAVMYGESGSGKSFMATDIAAAVARGLPWRDHKVAQGDVVYIAAEGANGFRNRLRAYAHQNSVDLKDVPIHVIHAAPNMMEKADALDVAKAILAVVGKPKLIVVDTLAQTMPGGNENAGEDMGKVLVHCRGLHRATRALVLLVHHSGKDSSKGARGWSGLRAAADVELEVIRADDDRVLSVTKQKDGDDGGEFGFRLETVLVDFDADGDEVTSCVIEHRDGGGMARVRHRLKGANQKLAMRVFDDQAGLGEGGVDREALIVAMVAEMDFDPAAGKKDRRREMAVKAIESLREVGLLTVEGARLMRAEA